MSLCGVRQAASGLKESDAEKFGEAACPARIFTNEIEKRVTCHGDDFTFAGTRSDLVTLDVKIVILCWNLRRTPEGLELGASRNPRRNRF